METLTLAQAQQIIAGALARSLQAGYKPMGVVVLDEAGQMKAFARQDGASMFRFDVAWQGLGLSGHECLEPGPGAACQGKPQLLPDSGLHG